MNKLNDVASRIIDAHHLIDLIEMAAETIVDLDADEPAAPKAGAISGVVRIVREKLEEAADLLDEAEAEAKETAKAEGS